MDILYLTKSTERHLGLTTQVLSVSTSLWSHQPLQHNGTD